MKIPTMLLQRVLLDVGLQLSDTIDVDYREICSRYQREGMSFLTITLPALDDALLQGLAKGRLTRTMYTGFRSVSRRRNLPALLSGFFRRIFDDDGFVLDEPDVCAISAIRQVTRLFKKAELPCSEPRVKAAYERYRSNDGEVDWRSRNCHYDSRLFGTISGILWAGLEMFGSTVYCAPGIFGSGATAERLKRNERFSIQEWPERAEGSFPAAFHALPREDCDSIRGITYLNEEEERPVRVVQVPKTLKTPRTISVEPSYMMLMQQSIAKPLMLWLESREFGFQSIRFFDQSVNQALARAGSLDGSVATIDLKDASDMVSNDLVREIFEGPCPTFLGLIQDCRTTKAQMPDKTIFPLRKFASMGSAMCFPIESMVFFTIIMYALVKHSGRVPSRHSLQALAKKVAIYGDDIAVESRMAPVVMETLEAFGLKVNHDKSFHTGLFRESCGGDYYNGVNVTPAYVRQWDDTGTLSKSSHLVAYVALSNTFYMKGLWHACQYLREEIERRIRKSLPRARAPIGALHFCSYLYDSNVTWDKRTCGYRVKGYRIRSSKQSDCPTNVAGFLGLAFQSRYHRDWLRGFKSSVTLAPDTRRTFPTPEVWLSVPSIHSRRCAVSGRGTEGPSLYGMGRGDRVQEVPSTFFSSSNGDKKPAEVYSRETAEGIPGGTGDVSEPVVLQTHGIWDLHHDRAQRTNLPNGKYSDEPERAWFSVGDKQIFLRQLLDDTSDKFSHLDIMTGSSLYTSDRPHALCLKRGWTASQAGLHW